MFYIGSDSAGASLKRKIISEFGVKVSFTDCDTFEHVGSAPGTSGASSKDILGGMSGLSADPNPHIVDYPDVASSVCERVIADRISGKECAGILICGTGIGMSIAANKYKGIRAAVCGDIYSARMTKEHNDANVICLGARVIGEATAFEIITEWLNSSFQGGRHAVRIQKIADIEAANIKS
ncbi:hypothetical protein FACS1894120_0630 [Clostridia bacterium]|nr:hypothetical protein FACS1894120_0630 [Clostridia bacterium]